MFNMKKTPQQIIEAIRRAGVIGANACESQDLGSQDLGFPIDALLQASVQAVIVNGIESEPLLANKKTLISTQPENLIEGLRWVLQTTGATQGILAIGKNDTDAIGALKDFLPESGSIRLHLIENYFPANDP